jgi:hypothetical protein
MNDMWQETKLKDFYGRVIGIVETDPSTGNKRLKDFYGRVLGNYEARFDLTKDFYGRVVGKGDILTSLLNTK